MVYHDLLYLIGFDQTIAYRIVDAALAKRSVVKWMKRSLEPEPMQGQTKH